MVHPTEQARPNDRRWWEGVGGVADRGELLPSLTPAHLDALSVTPTNRRQRIKQGATLFRTDPKVSPCWHGAFLDCQA